MVGGDTLAISDFTTSCGGSANSYGARLTVSLFQVNELDLPHVDLLLESVLLHWSSLHVLLAAHTQTIQEEDMAFRLLAL